MFKEFLEQFNDNDANVETLNLVIRLAPPNLIMLLTILFGRKHILHGRGVASMKKRHSILIDNHLEKKRKLKEFGPIKEESILKEIINEK